MTKNMKILIIRLSSIGDIVHCSGVPRNLKARFPHSEIHWLVRADNKELLKFNPDINKVISFDRALGLGGWIKLARELSKSEYSHVYDAHNNLRSHLLCAFLKVPHFVRRSKNRFKRLLLFWLKIDLFEKPFISTESYVTPLTVWGVISDKLGPALFLAPETKTQVEKLLRLPKPWIAVAPATAWPKKSWPLPMWKTLIGEILEKTNYKIVILAGPRDSFCEDLVLDPSRVLSLQGKLSLLQSAAVASLCDTLIVGDTGLLHMTEGLNKKVIGLFGPTPFGLPTKKDSVTLEVPLWCRPCTKDGSGICINLKYQKCMTDIKPEIVFDAFQKQIEAP